VRLINSGMYCFGTCSIWHLAAVSVVRCTIIIRPLTHFTIFTDRLLRLVVAGIWLLSLVIGGCGSEERRLRNDLFCIFSGMLKP